MCGFLQRLLKKDKDDNKRMIPALGKKQDEIPWEEVEDIIDYEVRWGYENDSGIIIYIKLTNRSGMIMGGPEIKTTLSKIGILKQRNITSKVDMLNHMDSAIFKCLYKPIFNVGDTNILPTLSFFDFNKKRTVFIDLPPKKISVQMPEIQEKEYRMKEIFSADWKVIVSTMENVEMVTQEIGKRPSEIFSEMYNRIKELGFHSFKPDISPRVYRAIGRFWAEGPENEKYGVQLEVIGDEEGKTDSIKCKGLLIFFASDHMKIIPLASGVISHLKNNSYVGKTLVTP